MVRIAIVVILCFIINQYPARADDNKQKGVWYYCQSANTYYPYINKCPEPWKEVEPNLVDQSRQSTAKHDSSKPTPLISQETKGTTTEPSQTFLQGQRDREQWEAWFNDQPDEAKAGAGYWAERRSLSHPGTCMDSLHSPNWVAGCLYAQRRLAAIDTHRKSNSEYRRGFNAPISNSNLPIQMSPPNQVTPLLQGDPLTQVIPIKQPELYPDVPHGKIDDKNGLPFLMIIIIIGATFIAYKIVKIAYKIKIKNNIRQQKAYDKRLAIDIINSNAPILAKKKRQCVITDDYGMKVIKNWEKEMNYFIKKVLVKQLDKKSYILDEFDVVEEIECAINRCPLPEHSVFKSNMSPLDYERMCADILTADGWHARITKASGDQGVDVVADRNGVRIVLQCKLYSSPVGNSAVQEVFAGKVHEEAQYAAVVTNAGYTVGARQIANKTQVALLHHDDLKAWCHSCLSIA